MCHVLKGNKPDFHNAMNSESSRPMYDDFLIKLGSMYNPAVIKGAIYSYTHTVRDTRSYDIVYIHMRITEA